MTTIDSIHSLAFSIQAKPGVYALLLGSGLSSAAQIPTGWEITLDLIRKLAAVRNESCDPDPEFWFTEKYGQAPDYSKILEQIARTPAQRQQLLQSYFEPSVQEREKDLKQPTAAHRSIAELAAQGFFKVIVTTNFDRLLEMALADAGVVPTVLSSPDDVRGATPLIHSGCCVFKLHGDYLDTRIRNTPNELDEYPEEFDQLLDRIIDEFGLIVCGWSAEWDTALRNAIERALSHRYTTYWALFGEATDRAKRLIDCRQAQTISIIDADDFFKTIQENVESLQEISRPHPLSTEAAVANMKRYLPEQKHRINLSDLIDEVVEGVISNTSGESFSVQSHPSVNTETITARLRAYEASCTTLIAMAAVGGRWANDEHIDLWQRALYRLSEASSRSGIILWLNLQRYPATLLLYALGIGAIEGNKLDFIGQLFSTELPSQDTESNRSVPLLAPAVLFDFKHQQMQLLEGMERRRTPISDWLHENLRQSMADIIPSDTKYALTFDKFEVLVALNYGHQWKQEFGEFVAPLGAFLHRSQNRQKIFDEIKESISRYGEDSPLVLADIFGNDSATCLENLDGLSSRISKTPWH